MKLGFALPVVLFAISLGSALAVGGVYVTRQLASGAKTANRGLALESGAEKALVLAVADWDSAARASQIPGSAVHLSTAHAVGVKVDAWVSRTTPMQYWLVAEALNSAKPMLRRRLGVLISVDSGGPRVVSGRAWSDLP